MPTSKERPNPTPAMLRWGREQAGYTPASAAKAAGVPEKKLDGWERGLIQPTWTQFTKLANAYELPTAVFYATEPPRDYEPVADFRRATTRKHVNEELVDAIRQANRDLETATELVEFVPRDDNWQQLSEFDPAGARRRLGVTVECQQSWESESEAFRRWSDCLQLHLGVLVYQFPGVDVELARGFSLDGDPLRLIAVNSADSYRGRVFTLFHELGHLILRQRALCDHSEVRREEVKCNAFAGRLLVPKASLLRHEVVADHDQDHEEWSQAELRKLANAFWVSEYVILRRLLDCGLTTQEFYEREQARLREHRASKRSGFVPPDQMALARHGVLYVGLVLDAYHSRCISGRDFYDVLGLHVKYADKLAERIERRSL